MNWEPTNELRFLKRPVPLVGFSGISEIKPILQQKWEQVVTREEFSRKLREESGRDYTGSGACVVDHEWRDVPMVEE